MASGALQISLASSRLSGNTDDESTAGGGKGMGDVEEKMKELLKELLLDMLDIEEKDITPEARFVDDLKATSIDIIEIVSALQNTFDVDIGDSEVARLVTVQDAVDFLKSAIDRKEKRGP
jgi:acyl carrier protein